MILRRIGVVLLAAALPGHAAAQHAHGAHAGASATLVLTHATPAVSGDPLTEGYVSRPILMGFAPVAGGALELQGMLNLEGLTLERGELNAGIWGEGYIDRRHPHTYFHEFVATAQFDARGVAGSLTGGLGFAPFGTDDPMTRPFQRFPANHHLAQVLERWVLIGGVRTGPVTVEGGLFNGDEPMAPETPGRIGRFGDSWSARVTVVPVQEIEVQASHARVESPEHRGGLGLDQRKWSASARWRGDAEYLLAEWARTDDVTDGDRTAFTFDSFLVEGLMERRGWGVALRVERTERPEEERLASRFRTLRPHLGPEVVGITRWTAVSGRIERPVRLGPLSGVPFVEATRLHVEETTGSIFVPEEFYGSANHWALSAGVRIDVGAGHGRMGRYGVARMEEK